MDLINWETRSPLHAVASVLHKPIGIDEQLYKSEILILADQWSDHSSIDNASSGLANPGPWSRTGSSLSINSCTRTGQSNNTRFLPPAKDQKMNSLIWTCFPLWGCLLTIYALSSAPAFGQFILCLVLLTGPKLINRILHKLSRKKNRALLVSPWKMIFAANRPLYNCKSCSFPGLDRALIGHSISLIRRHAKWTRQLKNFLRNIEYPSGKLSPVTV